MSCAPRNGEGLLAVAMVCLPIMLLIKTEYDRFAPPDQPKSIPVKTHFPLNQRYLVGIAVVNFNSSIEIIELIWLNSSRSIIFLYTLS